MSEKIPNLIKSINPQVQETHQNSSRRNENYTKAQDLKSSQRKKDILCTKRKNHTVDFSKETMKPEDGGSDL